MKTSDQNTKRLSVVPGGPEISGQPQPMPTSPIDTAADPLVSTTGHRAPYDYPAPTSKMAPKK